MSSDIAYVFSHPLVHGDAHTALEGGALDLEGERQTLRASLAEADRAVRVRFDAATVDNLRALMTHGTKVLHYSGHGFENALALENGRGALHPAFTVDKLSALFSAGGTGTRSRGADDGTNDGAAASTSGVQLVFVAACNSEYVGRAFVAAGVPHVVAVRCAMADGGGGGSGSAGNESSTAGLVSDQAARVFVRSFYLALLVGRSVANAFDIGRARVLADPVHHVAADASKFMLLPTASDREAALALPSSSASSPPPPPHHLPSHRHHHVVIFPADSTPRGAWSLINPPPRSHIPPPPEFFFGRQLEMFRLVNKLMARRLVVLHGGVGVGKSALAVSSAHYLHQRHEFATALIDVAQHAQLLAVASARQRPIGSASAFSAHAASSGSMPNAAFAPTLVRTASEAPYVLSHASAASSSSDRSDALRPLQSVHRSSRDLMLAVLIDLANAALVGMHDKAASSFAFELDSYQRGESDDIADSTRDLCRRVVDAIRQSRKALLLVFDHADFADGGTSSSPSSSSSSSSSDHMWSAVFAHLLHALLSADPLVHVLVVARAGLAASSSSSSSLDSTLAWDHNSTDRAAAPTGQPLFPTVPSTMHIDVLSPTLALRLAQSTMSRSLVAADFFDGADESGAASTSTGGSAVTLATAATAATTAAERRNKLIDMIAFTGGNPRLIVFCTSALDALPFSALLFLIQSLADDMRHATAGAIGEFDRDPRAFLDVCVASLPSGNGSGSQSHGRHRLAPASPASPKSGSAASPKFGAVAAPALVVSDSTRALIMRLFQLWRHILPPPLDCSSVRSVQPLASSLPSAVVAIDGAAAAAIGFPLPSASSAPQVSCAALGTAPCEVMDQAARNALRSASLLSSFDGRASAHRLGLLVGRDGNIICGHESGNASASASNNSVASGTVNSVTETAESLLVLARWDLTRGHISAALASTRQAQDTLWSTCGWVGSGSPFDIHFAANTAAAAAAVAADHAQPGGLSAPATEPAPAPACIAFSVLRALSPAPVDHRNSTPLRPPLPLPAQLGDALLLEAEILLGAKHELRRAWVCLRAAACVYRSVGDALGVAWTLKSAAEWRVTVLQLRLGNWALFAFACGSAPADAFEAASRGADEAADEDEDKDGVLGGRRVFIAESDGALLWPGDCAIDQVRAAGGSRDESGLALAVPGSDAHGHGSGHDIVRLAAQNARDALSIFRHTRDAFGACASLRVLGWCALLSGAHACARGLLRESHRLALALDRPLSAIASIRLLGSLAVGEQDFGGARALLLSGVKCARLLANAMVEACTRRALADALFAQGALEVAAFNVRASLPSLERDAWMKREKALALRTLGQVQLAQSGELGLSNVASAVKLFGELRAECVRQFPTLDMLQCGLLADGLAEGGDWSAGNVDAAAAPVGAAAAVPPDAPNAAFINMGVLVGRQSNQVHTHLAPSSASPFSSPSFSSSASAASSNSSSSLAQSIAAPWARVAVGISPFASAGDAVANGTDSLYTSASAIGSAVSASSFPSSAHDSQQSNQIGRGNSSVAASPGLSPSASSSWFASAAERDAAAWSKYFAHLDAGLFWAYAHSTQWRRRRVKLRVRAGVPFAHRRAAYWVMLRAAAAVECQTPALYASLSGEQTAATMVVMPSSDNTRGTTRSGAEHGSIGSGPASVIAVDDSLSSAASLFATRVDRAFSASRLGRHFRGLFVPRPALLRLVRAVCAYDSKLLGAGMVAPDMNDGGTVRDRDRDSAQSAGDDFVLGQVTVLAAHLLLLMVEEEAFFVVLALLRGRFGLARLIAEARAALYPYPSPPLSHVFASSSSSSASDASISAVPSHADSVFAAIAQRLVCLRLPALHAHLDLHCPALVARYTLRVAPSLLADALPPDCALRVWDVLFFDGHKTLLRWVLALLAAAAADLRSIAPLRVPRETPAVIEASMLACLAEHAERLQTHPDALIDAIVSVPLTGAELAAIEVECLGQGNGRVDAQPDLMASVRNRRYFV